MRHDPASGAIVIMLRSLKMHGMAQAVAHRSHLPHRDVQFVGFGREQGPVDLRSAAGREHARDLVQRKTGRAAERNQCQALEYAGIEHAAQAAATDRNDQAFLFIETQGRGRNAGSFGDFGNADVVSSRTLLVMSKPACIDTSAFPASRLCVAQSWWAWR